MLKRGHELTRGGASGTASQRYGRRTFEGSSPDPGAPSQPLTCTDAHRAKDIHLKFKDDGGDAWSEGIDRPVRPVHDRGRLAVPVLDGRSCNWERRTQVGAKIIWTIGDEWDIDAATVRCQ